MRTLNGEPSPEERGDPWFEAELYANGADPIAPFAGGLCMQDVTDAEHQHDYPQRERIMPRAGFLAVHRPMVKRHPGDFNYFLGK